MIYLRAALRDDLHAVHARLTRQVLATTDATTDASAEPEDRVITWQDQNAIALSRAASMLEEIVDTDGPELAQLSVGLRAELARMGPGAEPDPGRDGGLGRGRLGGLVRT